MSGPLGFLFSFLFSLVRETTLVCPNSCSPDNERNYPDTGDTQEGDPQDSTEPPKTPSL